MLKRRVLRAWGHCHVINFGIRNRLIRLMDNPDRCPSLDFEVDFFGFKYGGNLSSYIDWNVFYYGAYERDALFMLQRIFGITKPRVIFDIGANVGHHALFFAAMASRVHAFEPFPPVARHLLEKCARNGLKSITLHPIGLGDRDERRAYSAPESSNEGTGRFLAESAAHFPLLSFEIRKGDSFVSEIGAQTVDFIKMDVEGFERRALTGLRDTLRQSRPVCFVEWSTADGHLVDGRPFFPPGYSFYLYKYHRPNSMVRRLRAGRYVLERIRKNWASGEILAIPDEAVPALTEVLKDYSYPSEID